MNNKQNKLSDFTKKEIEKIQSHKGNTFNSPVTKNSFNFWSLDAEAVYPNSQEMQDAFNKKKQKVLKKRNNL
ncbi:hypothetical protein O0Q50_23055 [Priestia aryabhattai]|uniref:Uncharacterized protein n=1 Tax=Priestia aryabhattai TaxID=412384 RepID=A0AAX6NEY8_PRIAR|nr:hypothetical protein [Priestia aryabhattai]MDU9694065.1 hypothetical protein [Priestia aryabhattai]